MRFVQTSLALLISVGLFSTVLGETKPFGNKLSVIPGKIEAEHFDLGKAGVAYYDVDEKNLGEDYREPTQVDIEKRSDASNGHGLGWTKAGEWLWYSVDIRKAGKYSITMPVASNKEGGIFHLEIGGKNITGPIKIPDTGGWDKLKIIQVKNVPLPKGKHRIKMVMDEIGASKSIGDIDYLLFEVQP